MSKSGKKSKNKPAQRAQRPASKEPGAFLDDEVVHVPKGKSPLRFYLVLALMLFVLVIFTVGDLLPSSIGGNPASGDYMTWVHPKEGIQRSSFSDLRNFRLRISEYHRVQGSRAPREQASDEYAAFLMITDRLARDAGIAIAEEELRRVILEGEQGLARPFLTPTTYTAQLRAARVSSQEYEETLRMLLRTMRYQSLIALSLAQPAPETVERLWREEHQEHAFDLVGLPRADMDAAAEAELPDADGLEAWYDDLSAVQKQQLFSEHFLPIRQVAGLISWDANGEAPAALLESYPRPEGQDLETLATAYHLSYQSRRYRRPEDTTGGESTPEEEPSDEEPSGDEDPEEDAQDAAAAGELQEPFLTYEEVAERALVEAQVNAAMGDFLATVRSRLVSGEELDLEAEVTEVGLTYESDGLPRNHDAWVELGDLHLANEITVTRDPDLSIRPVVGEERIWAAHVLERMPSEAPPYADIPDAVREAWLVERAAELAREKLEALSDALVVALEADTPDDGEGAPDEGDGGDEATQDPVTDPATDPATVPVTDAVTDPLTEDTPVVVDAETFAAKAAEAGLEVVHLDWFDPTRPSPLAEEDQTSAEVFLRTFYYRGLDLYGLEADTLSTVRAGLDGEIFWLVRSLGSRDPLELSIRPAEYADLRRQALFEVLGDAYQRMSDPEQLAARFDLAFPGRVPEDELDL